MKIAIHHKQNCGIIIHLTDDDRQVFQPRKLGCVLTAMPGDDLVAVTVRAWACNQRRKHTVLLHAFHRALHGFIVQDLKGVVFEGK